MAGTTRLEGKNLKIAEKMLSKVCSFLDKNSIPYTLEGGTLLGIIRENRLLPWDNDMDLTIQEKYAPLLLKNLWKLKLSGLRVRVKKFKKNVGPFSIDELRIVKERNFKHLFFRGPVMVDIFVKRKIDQEFFWTVGIKKPVLKSAPASYYENLKRYKFQNQDYSVPENYDAYLTYRYGDWQTPIKTWDFKKDDQAIVIEESI